jgi:DNA-binding XRE family transcriptional regulator
MFYERGDTMELSEKLILYRAKERITQQELATRLGINRATVNLLENGKYNASRVLTLKINLLVGDMSDAE